jgi:hypothetical protein
MILHHLFILPKVTQRFFFQVYWTTDVSGIMNQIHQLFNEPDKWIFPYIWMSWQMFLIVFLLILQFHFILHRLLRGWRKWFLRSEKAKFFLWWISSYMFSLYNEWWTEEIFVVNRASLIWYRNDIKCFNVIIVVVT